MWKPRNTFLELFCLILAVGSVYVKTLAPTVLIGDGARLQLTANTLGIAHPPGYSVYLLVAHLFSRVDISNPAFRINLFSAVCSLILLGVVYYYLRKRFSFWPACLSVLVLAFSQMFWFESIRAEVYTFYLLLLGLAFIFSTQAITNKKPLSLYMACLFWGLYTAGRISAIPSALFFIVLILFDNRLLKKKIILGGIGCFVLPYLVSFIYLVLMDSLQIGYNYMEHYNAEMNILPPPEGWQNLLIRSKWILLAEQYRGMLTLDLSNILNGAVIFARNLFKSNLTFIGVLVAFWGIEYFFKRHRKSCLLLLFIFVNNFFYYLSSMAGDRLTFTLPSYFVLSMFFAIGTSRLLQFTKFKYAPIPLLSIPLFLLIMNYPVVNRSHLEGYQHLADKVFSDLPDKATLFTSGSFSMTLFYEQRVMNKRPDLKIIPIHRSMIDDYLSRHDRYKPMYYIDLNKNMTDYYCEELDNTLE